MLQIIMIVLSSGKLVKIFSFDFSLKDKYAIPMIIVKVRVLRIDTLATFLNRLGVASFILEKKKKVRIN